MKNSIMIMISQDMMYSTALKQLFSNGDNMIVIYKDKKYHSEYNCKTNTVYLKDGNDEINKIIEIDRIQRGLLLGTLLNNPIFNLDIHLKNK